MGPVYEQVMHTNKCTLSKRGFNRTLKQEWYINIITSSVTSHVAIMLFFCLIS